MDTKTLFILSEIREILNRMELPIPDDNVDLSIEDYENGISFINEQLNRKDVFSKKQNWNTLLKGKDYKSKSRVRSQIRINHHDINYPDINSNYANKIYDFFDKQELDINIDYNHIDLILRNKTLEKTLRTMFHFMKNINSLFIAVQLIDRYLSLAKFVIPESISAAGCFIALKYEEVEEIDISWIVEFTQVGKQSLLKKETDILSSLNFDLMKPNIYTFLSRYCEIDKDENIKTIATYIAIGSFFDLNLYQYLPSLIAACSVYIARMFLSFEPWNEDLIYYSKYYEEDLTDCSRILIAITEENISKRREMNNSFFDLMGLDLTLRIKRGLRLIEAF